VLVKDGRARLETHEVAHGVLVQVTASRADAVRAVHEAMGEISAVAQACGTPGAAVQVCDLCRGRMNQLVKASQDWAKTSTGATLMLTSEDPELVRWLREDGHAQQALVDRVASR
jgi:predicted TIM-barrel fold metal-dependent hydrolase